MKPNQIIELPGVCYNCNHIVWERNETKCKCCGKLTLQGVPRYLCRRHDETIKEPHLTGCEEFKGK